MLYCMEPLPILSIFYNKSKLTSAQMKRSFKYGRTLKDHRIVLMEKYTKPSIMMLVITEHYLNIYVLYTYLFLVIFEK